MPQSPPSPTAATLEEQLTRAYAMVDELHEMEVRLRSVVDEALTAIKGESA